MESPQVVILAGGRGMRLRELTELVPKPLVPIGDMPIIEHVMKQYYHQGFNRFVLCLGYKGDLIKEHFLNNGSSLDGTEIKFIDTGQETLTGGRIKKIERVVETDNFFATYCDGLADINLNMLFDFHKKKNVIATLTAVNPMSPFGVIEVCEGLVTSFKEKPMLSNLINGGFFVFNKKIFDFLNEDITLEEEPLRKLASIRQLAAYNHKGFWICMDTYKDYERLNKLWKTGTLPDMGIQFSKPPWKIW